MKVYIIHEQHLDRNQRKNRMPQPIGKNTKCAAALCVANAMIKSFRRRSTLAAFFLFNFAL